MQSHMWTWIPYYSMLFSNGFCQWTIINKMNRTSYVGFTLQLPFIFLILHGRFTHHTGLLSRWHMQLLTLWYRQLSYTKWALPNYGTEAHGLWMALHSHLLGALWLVRMKRRWRECHFTEAIPCQTLWFITIHFKASVTKVALWILGNWIAKVTYPAHLTCFRGGYCGFIISDFIVCSQAHMS